MVPEITDAFTDRGFDPFVAANTNVFGPEVPIAGDFVVGMAHSSVQ